MKNFTKKILAWGIFLLQLFAIGTASAAYSPASFMPQNPLMYLQFDTTKDHPLNGQLQEFLSKISGEENSIPMKLLNAAIDNSIVGFSQTINPTDNSEIYVLAFNLDENSFNQIVANAGTEVSVENLPLNKKIYLALDDFYFTYKFGNVIASNQRSIISDVLMTDNSVSLLKNPEYQNLISKINSQGFFTGFIDYQKMLEQKTVDSVEPIKIEGFSASQDDQGISGQFYLKFLPESLYKPETFSFTPDLYQKISPKNLLYFQEFNNLSGQIKALTQNLTTSESAISWDEINTEMSNEIGIDANTLSSFLEGKAALAIHSDLNNQYYPAFSLLSDVRGKEIAAQATIEKLETIIISMLNQSVEEAYQTQLDMHDYYLEYYPNETNPYAVPASLDTMKKDFYQTSTVSVNGTNFSQISINPSALNDGETKTGDATKYKLNLTFGVNNEGYLVISTLKDINNLFDYRGLLADSNFNSSLVSAKVTGISYLNFSNLRTYLHQLLAVFDDSNFISEQIDTFLSPLFGLTAVSTASSDSLLTTLRLNADVSKLSLLSDLFKSLIDELTLYRNQSYLEPLVPYQGFPDVNENDWFFFHVNSIHDRGIMNGYDDGTFRPNQPITRAEFVKTLVTTLDADYYEWKTTDQNISFKDLDSSAWYAEYVKKAAQEGLIKGYADGNFRPNQTINRAEAIQILFNASQVLQNTNGIDFTKNTFSDVKSGDWFFGPVESAKYHSLVNGRTPTEFKPNDSLTRAETAKIIEQFLHL